MSELEHPPWVADAACLGADPEPFFPSRGESTSEAKAVCAECPVRVECLEHALANREKFGIWGGLSERERRRVRRDRRRMAAALSAVGLLAAPEAGQDTRPVPTWLATCAYCDGRIELIRSGQVIGRRLRNDVVRCVGCEQTFVISTQLLDADARHTRRPGR